MIEYLKTFLWYTFDLNDFEFMIKNDIKQTDDCLMYLRSCEPYERMLWAIMVLKYGDYGVTPMSGWIEKDKLSDAIEYIINELYTNVYTEGSENK